MTSQSYRDVAVWQRAHRLVIDVYALSRRFPREEMFGLTSQLRRATSSVPMNIAEGFRRRGRKDKLHFYNVAQASLDEAEYQLLLAHDLGYGDTDGLRDEADQVARMLNAYMRGIAASSGPTR